MNIKLNGEVAEIGSGITVLELIRSKKLDEKRVVIERNRHVLQPSSYDVEVINDGDSIEIIHFVGGG